MFSKSLLVALLYLSVASSALAAPTNDFFGGFGGFGGKPSNNQPPKGGSTGSNTEQCGTAVQTVTVTAATTVTAAASVAATSAAATLVSTGGKGGKGTGKGGNNAGNGGAAGNNKGGATSSSSSSAAAATSTSAASGNNGGNGGSGGDEQSSLTLDPSVLAKGFENDGQDQPAAGQVASLTSSNNFINFCALFPNLPITNGQQIKTGSCNPAPMGIIAATTNMPSSKFVFPQNMGTVKANTAFTVQMAISNLETGHFVNANENYFSAPQQINGQGDIQGHSHIVIEQIDSLTSTKTTDPTKFAFFKGLNDAAQNGILSADVTAGLPAGIYRMASINTAANHQPVLVAVAQHGAMDDMIYFTVTDDGAAAGNATSTGAAAAASSTAAAAGKGAQGNKGGQQNQKGGKGKN